MLSLRDKNCDLGYLREAYVKPAGTIGYRCPGEPVEVFLSKGGELSETEGRVCLCNGLMSACGLAQVRRDGARELAVVTSGDGVNEIRILLKDRDAYGANDVIDHLDPYVGATP